MNSVSAGIFRRGQSLYKPPPDFTVSQWADEERRLSAEASAEPGRWSTDRAPYQRGIMDAINGIETEQVSIMSSAQIGKTEFILNMIGYHIDHDPAPILSLNPTIDMAQTFSKDRIAPMVRDTPAITNKVADATSRDSGNTLLHKSFPGGHLTLAGANSPASLASRPIRLLLADEIDRYPHSAGTEGDPLKLAIKRTTTFWNRKIVVVSTPTVKGVSRIEREYLKGTQEEYRLACPCCSFAQPLRWRNIIFKKDKLDSEAVTHACEDCGALSIKSEWLANPGTWVSTNPNGDTRHRSFHINELVSPWRRWEETAADFLEAKAGGAETLQVWVNTALGETFESGGETVDPEALAARREDFPAQCPADVLVLTCGVDTQDDRLELEVIGWDSAERSWSVDYRTIYGDPGGPEVWEDLDAALTQTYEHESGASLHIAATCIDSGGHYTSQVYDFCKSRERRRIYAIKGQAGEAKPIISASQRRKQTDGHTVKLFLVGVDAAKAIVIGRLTASEKGVGFCRWPWSRSEEYFEQLTSERMDTKFIRGFPVKSFVKRRARNEALDCRVYGFAALRLLNPTWHKLEANLSTKRQEEKQVNEKRRQIKESFKPKQRRLVRRGVSFASNWK